MTERRPRLIRTIIGDDGRENPVETIAGTTLGTIADIRAGTIAGTRLGTIAGTRLGTIADTRAGTRLGGTIADTRAGTVRYYGIEELTEIPVIDVNPYKIGNEIAKGKTGTVYEAKKKYTGEQVAVKIMTEGEGDNKITKEKLLKEFNLKFRLKDLCKKHFICYYDVFQLKGDGKLYLIMTLLKDYHTVGKIEWDDGGLMKNPHIFFKMTKKLTFDHKWKITQDLLEAVKTLHSVGIAHRNIKPENFVYNGKNTILMDYGLACVMPYFQVKNTEPECDKYLRENFTHPGIYDVPDDDYKKIDWEKVDNFSLAYSLYLFWYTRESNIFSKWSNVDMYDNYIKYGGFRTGELIGYYGAINYTGIINKQTEEVEQVINDLLKGCRDIYT